MLTQLRRAGFNRISIGVQSDIDEQLKALGRPHNYKQAQQAVSTGAPGWLRQRVGRSDVRLAEPDTRAVDADAAQRDRSQGRPYLLLRTQGRGRARSSMSTAPAPTCRTTTRRRTCISTRCETLEQFGYHQYEISNFAKDGYICRHNMKYWTGDEYLSFGPCAASDFAGKRFTIAPDIAKVYGRRSERRVRFCPSARRFPLRERAGEYLMLRLRTVDGVEEGRVYQIVPSAVRAAGGGAPEAREAGPVHQNVSGRWRLTPKGFMLSKLRSLCCFWSSSRSPKPLDPDKNNARCAPEIARKLRQKRQKRIDKPVAYPV